MNNKWSCPYSEESGVSQKQLQDYSDILKSKM